MFLSHADGYLAFLQAVLTLLKKVPVMAFVLNLQCEYRKVSQPYGSLESQVTGQRMPVF